MWPSFTMAMEALGTLVDDKIWLAPAPIFDFRSSGSAALRGEGRRAGGGAAVAGVDCARSPGLIAQ